MAISHVFSNTIADGTNTNIVRPSDWNSAHNQYYTLSGNTLGASTVSGTNVVFEGAGNVSLSGTGQTIVLYATGGGGSGGGVALSAGTQSVSSGTVSFANSNGISFGMSGSNQITASYTVPTQSVQTQASGNIARTGFSSTTTTGTAIVGTLDTNGLSLGVPAYVTNAVGGGGVAIAGGTQTATSGTVNFANSNGITFGMSGSNQITASYTVPTVPASYVSNVNGSSGQISLNVGSSLSSSINGSSITFGLASNITTALQSANANYLTSQSNQAFSASGGSSTFQTLNFANSNGVTFSNSGGSVVASYTVPTVPTSYVSNVNGSSGAISLNVGSSLSSSVNGSSITFGLASNITTALQSTGNYLTTARASNDAIGLNTAATNVTWTVNSSGISLNAGGYAGTGTSATNASITLNSAGLAISVAAPGGGGAGNFNLSGATSGNTTASGSTINLSGINITLSGTNNSQIAISAPATSSLSAGNNISISSNGSTIGFSARAVAMAAGTQTATSGTVNFANSNGITFGMLGSNQITASYTVPTQSVQTQASGNIARTGFSSTTTAGTAIVGTLDTNGLNLAVPAYLTAAAGGNFSGGVSDLGNTAGSTGITGTRIVFVGTNNISLSQSTDANGATISINQTGGGGLTNINVSAGTTSNNLSNIVFSNSNGVTFGLDGSTVTASVNTANGGGYTASGYSPHADYPVVAGQMGQGVLAFDPDLMPNLTMDRVALAVLHSHATNSTGTVTISHWVGLYTKNASTLSLYASTSNSLAYTFSGTANSVSYSGWRNLTFPWSTSFSEGRYWLAQASRTTTGGANATVSQFLASQINSNFSGVFGVATAASVQFTLGQGTYSATTSGMPNSVAFSQIQGSASLAQRFPIMQFGYETA